MEDSVYNHSEELTEIGNSEFLGIRADGIEREHDGAGYPVPPRVVEGNDVGVIVMVDKLTVCLQYLLVIYE